MTAMRPKFSSNPLKKGFMVLAVSVILLMVVTAIGLFAAHSLSTESKIQGNTYRALQAFDAAQAGLEYGINYAQSNSSTVTNGQVLTGTLANGSTYSVVLNYVGATSDSLDVVSTGRNSDSSATRVVKQRITKAPIMNSIPLASVSARGDITMKNNSTVQNLTGPTTVVTGGALDIRNNAQTVLSSGVSSTPSLIKSDVSQNNSSLSSMTDTTLQITYAGMLLTGFQAIANNSYSGTGYGDYTSQVSGQAGKIIYINQGGTGTVTTSNGMTIGSPTNPVIVVVNGNVALGNNLTVYGNIYATGNVDMGNGSTINGLVFAVGNLVASQNSTVNGAVVSGGTTTFAANNILVNYSAPVLNQNNQIGATYGKLNGSWQDMNL